MSAASDSPAGGALLRRPRLLSALDKARTAAVSAVYGPAGIGKTTVLRDWLTQLARSLPVLYAELAEAGTARLWSSADPAERRRPVDDLPAAIARLDGLPGPGAAPRPLTVVLDGIDPRTDAQSLRRLLDRLLPPPSADRRRRSPIRLVLGSRTNLELAASDRATPSVQAVITADDLRLTSTETAQLCAQRGLRLAPVAQRHLYAITGGWAAGLSVFIDTLLHHRYDTAPQLDDLLRTGAGLDGYLEHEVLSGLPGDVREAARAASILTSFNAALFTAVTGVQDSETLLATLAEQDRCLVALDRASGWYAFPRLWRAALSAGLLDAAPDRMQALHRSAAAWYAEHGRPAEARRHASAGGDVAPRVAGGPAASAPPSGGPPAASGGPSAAWGGPSATSGGPSATSGGRSATSEALVFAWHAVQAGNPVTAERHLAAAPHGSAADETTAARIRAVADCQQGRLRSAARIAGDLRAALHRRGIADSQDESWALFTLAAVAVQRGRPARAHRHLDELLVQNWPPGPALQACEVFCRILAGYQAGQVDAALGALEQLIVEEADLLVVPVWGPRAARVELLAARGLLGEARRCLDADAGGFPSIVTAIAAAKIDVADSTLRNPTATVERLLLPFLEHDQPSLVHAVEAHLLLGAAARSEGRLEQADRHLRRAGSLAGEESLRLPFIVLDRIAGLPAGPEPDLAAATAGSPPAYSHPVVALTEAETSVLQLLPGFLTATEIAAGLHLSLNTVKTHVATIYHKLGVHRRRDAVRRARQLGLL
ncbi:LuxR C-terminal-related transcriptional regulator [Dactylosporangium sp. NPDC051485]|uniref:LuxR C-terminal-related transcriptional regulator n=1 Tax=Dactylosporangium sp. NPDC051485 TaxID=3154846 RepID=UPI00341FC7D8